MRQIWVIAWCGVILRLEAAEPLAPRIDQLIAAKAGKHTLAQPAADGEFLRRVYLDFAGQIPTAADTRRFLADTSADKRARIIDALFSDPRWAETLAERFHIMLMERRGNDPEWLRWLVASFQANKPWDVMTREILAPDYSDAARRGAGYFIAQRLESYGQNPVDYPGLTRDVGRMFMGVDLQCAQCHHHLTVKDYKQVDFQGLFIVYQNIRLEGATGAVPMKWAREGVLKQEAEFSSVFSGQTKKKTGPRLPFGEPIAILQLKAGEEFDVPPDQKNGAPGRLKFSPLREIATRLTQPENPYFARNMANRAWHLLMGRGLIEPLDLAHTANPPSHPELLELLAKELVAHRFDLKWLLRELALTQTYQRSSLLPAGGAPEALFVAARERPIAAEAFLRSVLRAVGETERVAQLSDKDPHSFKNLQDLFQKSFANAPREPELDVNPTLQGALFLRNNPVLLWLVQRRPGNLVDRLALMEKPDAIAQEMFLSLYSRQPTAEEKGLVKSFLEKQPQRERVLGDWVWALLSSTEFFVNH